MSTLSDLRTNTRNAYLKIDPNGKVWDNNTLDYYVNKWYERVQQDFQYALPANQTSTTLSTIAGTTEYSKPTGFKRLIGIFDDSYKLTKIEKTDFLMNRASESKPASYYIFGSKIGLYPTPDSTYSLDLMYNKKLPELTATVDSELDEDYEDLVVLWACYLMLLSVEKSQKALLISNQYKQQKDSLFGDMYDSDDMNFRVDRINERLRDDSL